MGGYGNYDVRGREFYFHSGKDSSAEGLKAGNRGDAGSGFVSGETLFITGGTVDGDKDSGGKKIDFIITSPDTTGIVANGVALDGTVTFQNGQAAVTITDGSTVNIIDDFEAYNDGVPSTVTVDVGKPVTFATPALTLPAQRSVGLDADIITSPKPELTTPSKPTSGVTGISEVPGLKLKTDSGDSILKAEDIKTHGWWAKMRADSYDEVLKKKNEELAARRPQLVPEKTKPVKPPVTGFPGFGLVEQGHPQGDVSREVHEAEIPYSVVISGADSEKHIADFLESTGERDEKYGASSEEDITRFPQPKVEIKTLLGTRQSADYDSSIPAEGPAGKEENKRRTAPILGDIPLVGGLYRKERTWTDEEEKEFIAHLSQRKLQPQGESAGLEYETIKLKHLDPRQVENSIQKGFKDLQDIIKDMPVTGDQSKVLTLALPKNRQIIVFGSKDQREAVRNMVNAIDVPPGQSATESTSGFIGEDEPDLPPSSRFKLVPVNPWVMAERDPLSTFALDVDTASYALCRRYIRGGFLPPAGAVRMEEFINYFNYHYPQRTNPTFKVHAEAAPSPFARKEQNLTLLKIGVKARTIGRDQRKASNLILVVDASASMGQPDRLPLVQRALDMLVNRLADVDRVSLITCAGEARLHLETVPARERDKIRQAIYAIQPAGPTNLLAGLKLGYATARRSFAPKQINHVVLCSDGVANVGQTEAEAVLEEVAADRKQGITITCVGVGYGSYNDVFLEALANRGDGSYVFLDSPRQAQRVFVRQLAATLQTVAKDARIQVDFNPQRVRRYRLIGYENRDIEDKRFRDDTIDAGEVGSGQCSTALYELELIGQSSADEQGDLGTVFVRYRNVETGQIEEISSRLSSAIVRRRTVESAPRFFLAAGAARFAEILRQSEHARDASLTDVLRVVEQVSLALGLDRDVRELADLIRKAEHLPRSP
jgi:Ca-activated chloride channel family protein